VNRERKDSKDRQVQQDLQENEETLVNQVAWVPLEPPDHKVWLVNVDNQVYRARGDNLAQQVNKVSEEMQDQQDNQEQLDHRAKKALEDKLVLQVQLGNEVDPAHQDKLVKRAKGAL